MSRHYGGMGGVEGGRPRDTDDQFENVLDMLFGQRMRDGLDELSRDVWCALANVEWSHENGDSAAYSFRAAGDVVAAIIGRGDYMDWYCCGTDGRISDDIEAAMAEQGWTGKPRSWNRTVTST